VIKTLFKTANFELDKLFDWFNANLLSLNIKKTNYILFTNRKYNMLELILELKIDDKILNCVDHTKFLGVIIDNKLNWNAHVNYISLNISRCLGVIGRVKKVLPCNVLLMVYHTLIYPILSYCCIMWGCATKTILSRLVLLQKRSLWLITCSAYRSPTSPLFKRLKLLKLVDIYKCHTLQFMFKLKNNLLPKVCLKLCTSSGDCTYDTRH